ncbi:MAG: hypothetical protein KC656_18865 [Myxococcales bacterium]|nr:hypothetical protein [Myxococcales bacterium]
MLSLAVAWAAEAPVEARRLQDARTTLEAGLAASAVGGGLVGLGVALEDGRLGYAGFTTGIVGTVTVFVAKVRLRDLHRDRGGLRRDVLHGTRGALAASFGLVTLGGGLGLLAGAAGSWGMDAGVKLIVGTPVTATGLLLTIVGGQAWVRNRDGVVDWSLEPVWTPQLRGIRLQRRW